jgi:thioredoxin 1
MSQPPKTVTDATFDTDVLQSALPVLVDYWAPWCAPCRMIGPLVDASAERYEGRLGLAKINIDENQNTPHKYRVRSIPTLMIFKGGVPVATQVGAVSRAQLETFIENNL